MNRKYPAKRFWFFVFTNFLFHYFYLLLPGIILCFVGIRVEICLWIGLAVLGADLILSIVEQLRIRKAVMTSDNPEFNEIMGAFTGPDPFESVRKTVGEKIKSATPEATQNEDD